jgi:hypothetical protein
MHKRAIIHYINDGKITKDIALCLSRLRLITCGIYQAEQP